MVGLILDQSKTFNRCFGTLNGYLAIYAICVVQISLHEWAKLCLISNIDFISHIFNGLKRYLNRTNPETNKPHTFIRTWGVGVL